MKKWLIIIGAFLLLLFLAIRGIYKTVHRVDDERHWYVSELNLACTLQIDSVMFISKGGAGLLYCNLINGEIDNTTEFKLNKKLRHHKRMKFLTLQSDGRYFLLSRRGSRYQKGDSLQIDSGKDQIVFYREGKEFWRAKISNSLRDRVF